MRRTDPSRLDPNSILTREPNTGEGKENRPPHRLPKHLRRGKNAEKQGVFELGTRLGIRASGDDLVVVYPAFSIDESLNNDWVVTIRNASGWLKGGVKETGT